MTMMGFMGEVWLFREQVSSRPPPQRAGKLRPESGNCSSQIRRRNKRRKDDSMLWLKAFHVIFMVTWFAGLFYLPRLYVYHCEVSDEAGHARFCTMERKLYGIMSVGMVGTVLLGLTLWVCFWGWPGPGWLHAKFGLALGLVAYHFWLGALRGQFARRENRRSGRYYRIINEVPALFLIAMVILAIVKPF
jgi:putative membrane protein